MILNDIREVRKYLNSNTPDDIKIMMAKKQLTIIIRRYSKKKIRYNIE